MDETTGHDGQRVLIDTADGVTTLTMNRPSARNALDKALQLALRAAIAEAGDDPGCRVVVLRGAGPSFSAGADLRDRASRIEGDWAERRRTASAWQQLIDALEQIPQPTIAMLHGHVVGGGALVALACDLRIGASDTTWSIPELAVGLPLTWAGIPRLVREVGMARARELVMTGRRVEVDEALRIGLLHRAGAPDEVEGLLRETVGSLLVAPAGAMHATKAAFGALGRQVGGHELFWADPDLLGFAMTSDETLAHAAGYLARHLPKHPDADGTDARS